ncbi:unnamed protein product [Meloidogyne enterolobii]|uniref:Uncharacterized protein n=1 Tax=Meloidogyne enterolobii TaxID=390850 RepID=A0ACB0YB56_MELEN
MKIVRCWLEKLFLCYFNDADFKDYIINPEMIKILFENEENIPTQFRADECTLTFCKHNIENLLKFNSDHLIITQYLKIKLESFNEQENGNEHLLKLLFNGNKNIDEIWVGEINYVRHGVLKTLFDAVIKVSLEMILFVYI